MKNMNTKPAAIMLPADDDVPLIVRPNEENYAVAFANGVPFKITGAERVESVNYEAFVCPGMFLGSCNCDAPHGRPWPLAQMFSGFSWPGGQSRPFGGTPVPFFGTVDLYFRICNVSNQPQRFRIKLLGLEPA